MEKGKKVFWGGCLWLMLICFLPGLQVKAGLVKKGGYEYFKTKDGYLVNAWKTIDSKRSYFDAEGRRVKAKSIVIKQVRYRFDADGFLKPGLRKTAKGLRYQRVNGTYLKKTWKRAGGSWYYFNKKGYAVTKKWVGSYYLGADGKMKTSTWVGSRFVDATGKKVTKTSLPLSSPSAILIDYKTGKILYQKNANVKRANASTTKIMTAILALENGNKKDVVTFSSYAASQEAVKIYANPGEKFKLGDLLYALLLPSYNDVATAIGEHIAGSASKFAVMMNQKAKELGCKNTTFVTASGLDEGGHGTTAADLAKIARYAFSKKEFRQIIKTRSYRFASVSSGRVFNVSTTDQFLDSMAGAAGIKTGYTSKAGHCLVGALRRNGRVYISVVLGAPSSSARWSDTRKLMEFGIQNY